MPSELRTAGKRFAKAISSVGSDKAFDAVDTDEFFSDSVLIANHLAATCGFPGGNVEAVDHGFRGLPSTVLEPGTYVVGCFLQESGQDDQRTHAAGGMIAAGVAT
jgi:hypothetical protein